MESIHIYLPILNSSLYYLKSIESFIHLKPLDLIEHSVRLIKCTHLFTAVLSFDFVFRRCFYTLCNSEKRSLCGPKNMCQLRNNKTGGYVTMHVKERSASFTHLLGVWDVAGIGQDKSAKLVKILHRPRPSEWRTEALKHRQVVETQAVSSQHISTWRQH